MADRCPRCAGSGVEPDRPAGLPEIPCVVCGGSGEVPDEQMELT